MYNLIRRVLTFIALLMLAPSVALADSWPPPETEAVVSANGQWRFTVEPSPIDSQLAYFSEKVEEAKGGQAIERPAPMGLLARRAHDGDWDVMWGGPLVNELAPVTLLVANNGYVVTFDNWHSVGHGEHVIVIYDPAGQLVRTMPLTALVPQDYKDALPHSVSSLSWRADAQFSADDRQLLLDVIAPQVNRGREKRVIPFAINLADGTIIPPPDVHWQAALAAVAAVQAVDIAARNAKEAYLRAPLTAPVGCDTREWQDYMREVHARLTPHWLDSPVVATEILFAPDHPRFQASVDWMIEAMVNEEVAAGEIAVASPCHDAALVPTLRQAFTPIVPGALSETIFYISASPDLRAQLEPIVMPTGAQVIWIDPAKPIPQRAERIPNSPEASAAQAEREKRQMMELNEALSEF